MLYTILKIILITVVGVAVILKFVFMKKEIKALERKNAHLSRENRQLMLHNGKLFDKNQELIKETDTQNTPSFEPW